METADDAPMDDALALAEAEGPGKPHSRRLSRRWLQVLAGLAALVLFAVAGIALAGGPDGDRVETADRVGKTTATTKAAKDRRGGASAATVGGSGKVGTSDRGGRAAGSGSKRDRTAAKSGKRSNDKAGDTHDGASRGGGKAGEPGSTTSSSTVPAGAPRPVSVSPDPLPSFALVSVSPSDPCPAGTPTVTVELVGVGGTLDGVVVATRQVPVAGDGAWALDPFPVPAVGPVEGVAWAATADHLDVFATCSGGPRSAAAPLTLSPVTTQPTIVADPPDGTTVHVSVTECPTEARVELVVGMVAPVPGPDFQPTTTAPMTAGADPGSWAGSAEATGFDPSTQGLWATAACLSEVGGTPVWHYTVTELDPP